MLCALAFLAAAVFRIPVVLFLRYDPKDIIIVTGGFIFGPLTAALIAFLVSLMQMFTVSGTGFLGFLMNVISSCAFACTAACIYRKRRRLSGAVTGLICGVICQTALMLFWNYLVAPLYMGYSREAVAGLLLPAFLPFNLIKGCLNAAGTLLLYKPGRHSAAALCSGLIHSRCRKTKGAYLCITRFPVCYNTMYYANTLP